jgi:hypothetical protein
MHSDFCIGGLKPGETKKIRGKIYHVPSDVAALVRRCQRDFPEHRNECVGLTSGEGVGPTNRGERRERHLCGLGDLCG